MTPELLAHLRLSNPWLDDPSAFPAAARHRLPERFIPRLVPAAADWPVTGKAHLLVGGRQTGKSSFLWQRFVAEGRAPLLVNAEEPIIREWCASPTAVAADVGGLLPPGSPVLLDEAQHLAEAGLLVKGLVDAGLPHPLYVTGSSAFHLRARTRESLAGRAVRASMHPLGLSELAAGLDGPPLIRLERIRDLARRQMIFGGYPEAWTAADPGPVALRLLEAFVVRDASDLFRVQNLEAFRRLLRLLAGQIGSLVNVTEWASACGVSRTAISGWLDLLEETRVIRVLRPFRGGRRAEAISRPKVYFCDNGIRNAVTARFGDFEERADRGPLFENWAAAELVKTASPLAPGETLDFWRSKSGAEVDFVAERGGRLLCFEIKAANLRRPELSRSARSFIEAYRPARFHVVNLSFTAREDLGGTEVVWGGPELLLDPAGPDGGTK
jgi:hypothetical protein